jgi:hypothetical protein
MMVTGRTRVTMHAHRLFAYTLALVLPWQVACDKSEESEGGAAERSSASSSGIEDTAEPARADVEDDASGASTVSIAETSIDLDAIVKLVVQGHVDSAASLEVALNAENQSLHTLDVERDGEVDPVQVVELEAEGAVVFEIRAVPSSTKEIDHAVAIATIELEPLEEEEEVEVRAAWSTDVSVEGRGVAVAEVEHSAEASVRLEARAPVIYRARAEVRGGIVVHASAPFVVWAFAKRPTYYGIYVRDHRGVRIPPGHAKHGHWKATGTKPGGGHGRTRVAADAGKPRAAKAGPSKGGKGKSGKGHKGGKGKR